MKKVQKVLYVLLAVLISAAMLTACPAPSDINEGEVSVVVKAGAAEYPVRTEKSFLGEILDELAQEGLYLKASGTAGSEFGRWLDEIGTLIPNPANNEFIALYATTENMNYTDPLTTKTVDGVKFYSAIKGIDQMPLIDGVIYMFVVGTY